MTSGNVELVQAVFTHWERGEYGWTDWAHSDIEFVFADGPTPGSWRGLAGLSQAWGDFLGAWEDFRSKLDELRELDDERVLTLAHYEGRGRTSGVEIGEVSRSAGVFHFRDGKVAKLVFYFDRERAVAEIVGYMT
jgi:ketosteroid isomerase-like protein